MELVAPVSGNVIPISEVEDKIFASGVVGEGIGIDPKENVIIAPANGKIRKTVSTFHAVVIDLENGVSIILHIGIDTVKMEGDGFEALIKVGDRVSRGQPLIRFDKEKIEKRNLLATVILIVLDSHLYPKKKFKFYSHMSAIAGKTLVAEI